MEIISVVTVHCLCIFLFCYCIIISLEDKECKMK